MIPVTLSLQEFENRHILRQRNVAKSFFENGTFSVLRPLFKKEEGQGEREGGQGGGTQV